MIDRVRALYPSLPVIIVTGTGSEEIAVEALKRGAADYVIKSPSHIRRLPETIRSVLSRRRLEEDVERITRERDLFFERSRDLLCVLDRDGRVKQSNPAWESSLGWGRVELADRPFLDLAHPDDRAASSRAMSGSAGAASDFECRVARKGGGFRLISWNSFPALEAGLRFAVGRDVTERRQSEASLCAALREKEALLQEVHHRVKNNFQVMISLIDLQAEDADDEASRLLLQELEGQTRAMAFAYEQLCQSEDLSSVEMREYFASLAWSYRGSEPNGRRIDISIDVERFYLDISRALPCGLIVNELLANCAKFAFPPSYAGEPRVSVSLREDGEGYELVVEDNGVGLPEGFDWRSATTLGMRLVKIMALDQLEGSLDSGGGGAGARFEIRFDR